MTKLEFEQEIKQAIEDKPKIWRNGQAVFNYIDTKYGIARIIQFTHGIDCFNNDNLIDVFVDKAYTLLHENDIHEFPGDNMIEE